MRRGLAGAAGERRRAGRRALRSVAGGGVGSIAIETDACARTGMGRPIGECAGRNGSREALPASTDPYLRGVVRLRFQSHRVARTSGARKAHAPLRRPGSAAGEWRARTWRGTVRRTGSPALGTGRPGSVATEEPNRSGAGRRILLERAPFTGATGWFRPGRRRWRSSPWSRARPLGSRSSEPAASDRNRTRARWGRARSGPVRRTRPRSPQGRRADTRAGSAVRLGSRSSRRGFGSGVSAPPKSAPPRRITWTPIAPDPPRRGPGPRARRAAASAAFPLAPGRAGEGSPPRRPSAPVERSGPPLRSTAPVHRSGPPRARIEPEPAPQSFRASGPP
ncbi:hypothetical protein Pla163_27910 [Planctomycetes bacterium Pla163]|uniref:Uncharacterized protein n=1 Tax=Rohdeia mirabilis TaxID=2528008 RepID=A0A518D2F4_9BACT|nr:hypothetical protein Pla163_27910 [Planctomycetes bacterium Pla163]